jgi:hypothetical protein
LKRRVVSRPSIPAQNNVVYAYLIYFRLISISILGMYPKVMTWSISPSPGMISESRATRKLFFFIYGTCFLSTTSRWQQRSAIAVPASGA